MDCYFHHAVPSAAPCRSCGKAICATCRNDVGDCPGCVLAARIDAAAAARARIPGGVGPSAPNDGRDTRRAPQPEPQPYAYSYAPPPDGADVRVRTVADAATYIESSSTRALVALGYPFWPFALLALFDGTKNVAVRRHALQALAFNLFGWGVGLPVLSALAALPIVGWPVMPLLAFWCPLVFVASAIYGFKAYHNERVDVPFVSDFLDARLTA